MRKGLLVIVAVSFLALLSACNPYTELSNSGSDMPTSQQNTQPSSSAVVSTESLPHIHSYFGEKVAASCTEGGYMLHLCACGDVFTDSFTEPTGHDWMDWTTVMQPTEENLGIQERSCNRCDAKDQQFLEKLEPNHSHSYEQRILEPSCTENGAIVYTCQCGHTYQDEGAQALGHSFTAYLSNHDARCNQDGTMTAVCERCQVLSTITEPGSAPGHDWENWIVTKEATATEEGLQMRTCAACGATDSQNIECIPAVHTHSYTAKTIDPECTAEGYTLYTCSCGDSYRDNMTAALGHSWGAWFTEKEPTVNAEGLKSRQCDRCAAVDCYVLERLPAVHEHDYSKKKYPATCAQGAYTQYTCECGDTYEEITGDAKEHTWLNWYVSVDPTLTEEGQRQRQCAECGTTETGSVGKLQKVGGFVFVYWPETTGRNMEATVIIKGQPGVTYNIDVVYRSGISTASGLENKVADEEGYVTWTWKIGPSTAAGTYRIRVSGGDDKQTVYFTVVVE